MVHQEQYKKNFQKHPWWAVQRLKDTHSEFGYWILVCINKFHHQIHQIRKRAIKNHSCNGWVFSSIHQAVERSILSVVNIQNKQKNTRHKVFQHEALQSIGTIRWSLKIYKFKYYAVGLTESMVFTSIAIWTHFLHILHICLWKFTITLHYKWILFKFLTSWMFNQV